MRVPIRAANSYDTDEVSTNVGVEFDPDENLAQQQFRDECDINVIVKRFGLTGEMPEAFGIPLSGDFSAATDFQTSMQLVRQAEEAFLTLPAELRAEFGNDPQELLSFLENPENRDKAIELGLVARPVERTRDAVQAIDELREVLTPKT